MADSENPRQSETVDRRIEPLSQALTEQEIGRNRIVPLTDGQKATKISHSDPDNRQSLHELSAGGLLSAKNYGVYAGDGLLFIDIDDYGGVERPPAMDKLPETFTVQSPHGGAHLYYAVPKNTPELIEAEFGSKNRKCNWGEVRSYNQYVVGPGSQLEGCQKDWCDTCPDTDGGWYTVAEDHEIAEVEAQKLVQILRDVIADEGNERDEVEVNGSEVQPKTGNRPEGSAEYPEEYDPIPSEYTPKGWIEERALKTDETLRNLWDGNYAAAGYGGDRSHAESVLAWKLTWWVGPHKDRVRRLMNRASTEKWATRTDDGYRDSILRAVGEQSEYYSGSPIDAISPPEGSDIEFSSDEEAGSTLTRQEAHERTQGAIREAFESGEQVLVEALPTLGKSYGTVKIAAETDTPVTIFTERRELYDDVAEWCAKLGLRSRELPAMTENCPSYSENPESSIERKVLDLYERGATPRQIHETLDGLPCQRNGNCHSMEAWDFEVDEYDVLVGHYSQAEVKPLVDDRVVIVDECPNGVYDVVVDDRLGPSVSAFLSDLCDDEQTDLPEEAPTTYAALSQKDSSSTLGRKLRTAIESYISERDSWEPDASTNDLVTQDHTQVHRRAPEAAYAVLCGESTFNGFQRVEMPNGTVLLHDPGSLKVRIRDPPSFDTARSVVCLDGTPTRRLWESALGISFDNHETVLDADERRSYVSEVQGWEFVQTTTDYVYNYTRRENVNVEKSAAFVDAVRHSHEQSPTAISTKQCIAALRETEVIDKNDATANYGGLKSSNDFADHDLGIVLGTRHLPRRWVEREAAFEAESITPEGRGHQKTYNSEYGDALLQHMREHEVLQAAMRFGRDEDTEARVYVHTASFPEWVPAITENVEVHTHAKSAREDVIAALDSTSPPWTATDIHDHDRVGVTKRRVGDVLREFCDSGVLERDEDPSPYEYWPRRNMDNINRHGIVEGI